MLSAIVITKNEEYMIGECLDTLEFADEIIIVDTGNTDGTNRIAKSRGARIVRYRGPVDYAAFRNAGLPAARGDWLLYVDADERITGELQEQILRVIASPDPVSAYAIPRTNVFLGRPMRYGGWGGDYVIRLLRKSDLKGWENPLHEQPGFTGGMEKLDSPMLHISHRDLASMLDKTLVFTRNEASLRYCAGHPPVVVWRFFRVMATEFWHRFIRLSAWRDGPEGVIDCIFQVYNTFIIYARLWEMQQGYDHHP